MHLGDFKWYSLYVVHGYSREEPDSGDAVERSLEPKETLSRLPELKGAAEGRKVAERLADAGLTVLFRSDVDVQRARRASVEKGVPSSAPLPVGRRWVMCLDPASATGSSSGIPYYFNKETGQTTWERPDELGPPDSTAGSSPASGSASSGSEDDDESGDESDDGAPPPAPPPPPPPPPLLSGSQTAAEAADPLLAPPPGMRAARPTRGTRWKRSKAARRQDISGFLDKRGKRNTAWKSRWFAIRGGSLLYYKSQKDTRPISSVPLGLAHAAESAGAFARRNSALPRSQRVRPGRSAFVSSRATAPAPAAQQANAPPARSTTGVGGGMRRMSAAMMGRASTFNGAQLSSSSSAAGAGAGAAGAEPGPSSGAAGRRSGGSGDLAGGAAQDDADADELGDDRDGGGDAAAAAAGGSSPSGSSLSSTAAAAVGVPGPAEDKEEDLYYEFELTTPDRVYYLRCRSRHNMRRWIEEMNLASRLFEENSVLDNYQLLLSGLEAVRCEAEEAEERALGSLDEMLATPDGLKRLRSFARAQHMDEYVTFWEAAEAYRLGGASVTGRDDDDGDPPPPPPPPPPGAEGVQPPPGPGREIYDRYLRPGAAHEVMLPAAERKEVERTLVSGGGDPERQCFVKLQRMVHSHLAVDLIPRYLESDEYRAAAMRLRLPFGFLRNEPAGRYDVSLYEGLIDDTVVAVPYQDLIMPEDQQGRRKSSSGSSGSGGGGGGGAAGAGGGGAALLSKAASAAPLRSASTQVSSSPKGFRQSSPHHRAATMHSFPATISEGPHGSVADPIPPPPPPPPPSVHEIRASREAARPPSKSMREADALQANLDLLNRARMSSGGSGGKRK